MSYLSINDMAGKHETLRHFCQGYSSNVDFHPDCIQMLSRLFALSATILPLWDFLVIITSTGWEFLEKDKSDQSSKTQVFVAMSFDKALQPVYENSIAPAILSTGYRPFRVDTEPHLERIDAKIIVEIKNSRFMVADVTQQKAGVYYEAGFAHGLGIPVIWCVKSDDLANVHFDTRQYNHILWETEDELKENLIDFILATIGKK